MLTTGRIFVLILLLNLHNFAWGQRFENLKIPAAVPSVCLQAEDAGLNKNRTEVLTAPKVRKGKVVALKAGAAEWVHKNKHIPDLLFDVKLPTGKYVMSTFAVTDTYGEALMAKAATKYESLYMKIQVDDGIPSKKVIYVPWNQLLQETGKFNLKRGGKLKLWLPRGVQLDWVKLNKYVPPAVPEAAQNYEPKITPNPAHPRLWINPQILPQIRANLTIGENKPVWEAMSKRAAVNYSYAYDPNADIQYDNKLEQAASEKAFVYLMTGDKKLGRQAIDLMIAYIPNIQFSNLLDITRQIGRTIVSCAFVYDYCYDLMTPQERIALCNGMLRLADDMECGWPPFGQSVIIGHGNEWQINRDLLSMSLAIYGENNKPYKYCSYRILEELLPMRKFEYQSNRHNQGIGYGTFRFGCEMNAVWLMRCMAGREVFDPSIKTVYNHWLYGRMPDGSMMLDGDGSLKKDYGRFEYTTFLCYTYNADPFIKCDFEKQGSKITEPIVFLMLNDPSLKADCDFTKLPQVHYFKDILPSMIFRTGWNIGPDSSDAFIEMKGGGYNFSNHQHTDAGAFQIFYRGMLAADIGQYLFFGTPYDKGFNKRSVAHNTMLIYDPCEKLGVSNDGGQRRIGGSVTNVEMLTTNPQFCTGRTLGADFGPDTKRPAYCYFKTNLAPAYLAKIKFFTRTFCALNTGQSDNPAVLITVDRIESANPEFKKYYVLNSLFESKQNGNSYEIISDWPKNPGKLTMQMLLPEKQEVQILKGEQTCNVFGTQLTPPQPDEPQAKGCRTMFAPAEANADDIFVAVMAIGDADAKTMPVEWKNSADNIQIAVGDFLVVLGKGKDFMTHSFQFTVPTNNGKETKVLLGDLAAGKWLLRGSGRDGGITVEPDKHTAYISLPAGEYEVAMTR